MRVTTKGQVTIPLAIREELGIHPHTEVRFTVRDGVAVIEKVLGSNNGIRSRGEEFVARLRGSGTVRMSTDEIMALTRGED